MSGTPRTASRAPSAPQPQTLVVGAAVAVGVGLAWTVLGENLAAALLTVGGLLALVIGVHRLGRSGIDGSGVRARRRGTQKGRSRKRPRTA